MTDHDAPGASRRDLARAITAALSHAEQLDDAGDHAAAWDHASAVADQLAAAVSRASRIRTQIARNWQRDEGMSVRQLSQRLGLSPGRTGDMLRERGSAREPEHQPVVAAIVTSPLGVLATRRTDGTPPWGFVAGKVEPGESAADAAVREVKEETGLDITVGRELGRRVHPDTQVTMIYVSAEPARGTEVSVGDPAELAEVRWVPFDALDGLMPGIFEPVRAFLAREPRRQQLRRRPD